MRYPVRPLTYGELKRNARPSDPNQPEAYADILFDVREYVDNTTTELTFFRTPQDGVTLSNLDSSGQLPAGNFFALEYITLDLWPEAGWATTAAGGVTGIADDLGLLFYLGAPVLKLNLNQKPYGPWPALAAGASGGISAFGYGTFTAEESIQFAANAPGGLYIGGSIIIPPLTGFNLTLTWGAAVDLTDDYLVRMNLHGTRYRQVA